MRLGGGDDIEGRGSRVEGLQGAMSDGGEEDESGAAPRAADDEAASAEEEEAAAAGGGDAEEEGGEKGEGGDGSRSSSDGEGCAVRLFAFAIRNVSSGPRAQTGHAEDRGGHRRQRLARVGSSTRLHMSIFRCPFLLLTCLRRDNTPFAEEEELDEWD